MHKKLILLLCILVSSVTFSQVVTSKKTAERKGIYQKPSTETAIASTTSSKKSKKVKTPTTFSMYYIYPTDTILPFSISEKAEKDYAGRIERIDTYDYKEDMFVSLQLFSKQNWNDKAKAFFDFNEYIRKTKK